MEEIFEDLKEAILSLEDGTGKKVFRHADIDSGQMQRMSGEKNLEGEVIIFPAVFIKFENIKYSTRGGGVALAEATVRLKMVLSLPSVKASDIFKYRKLLNLAVMDAKWERSAISMLKSDFEEQPEQYDNKMEWLIHYRVKFMENSAFIYRDFFNANDLDNNPNAPVEMDVTGDLVQEIAGGVTPKDGTYIVFK